MNERVRIMLTQVSAIGDTQKHQRFQIVALQGSIRVHLNGHSFCCGEMISEEQAQKLSDEPVYEVCVSL